MSHFVLINLRNELVADETAICKFRGLLEVRSLGEHIFTEVGTYWDREVSSASNNKKT